MAILGLSLGVFGMVGMALLTHFPLIALLYVSVLAFAIGQGIFDAARGALISTAAPAEAQGGAQAFGSLAQMVGPLGGGQLYSRLGPGAIYGTAAALALGVLLGQRPQPVRSSEGQAQEVS